MASSPAGKKPAPKKTTTPAARKKAAGVSSRLSKPAPKTPAKPAPKVKPPVKAKTAPKAKPPVKAPTRQKKAPAAPAAPANPAELTHQQQRFVDEYMVDLNATQAAIRAGYSAKTAAEQACRLLINVKVAAAIEAERIAQQERTQITADKVLRETWSLVIADARELVQVKVGCCRHCYGEGFRRQRTLGEYNRDREEFSKKPGAMPADFEEEGGIGFDPHHPPHPGCPECGGDGSPRISLGDTRRLSTEARNLYAGAEQTKHGIKIHMHSVDAARERMFKHVGLYEKDNQQRVDPLASLLHTIASGNNNGFKPVARDPERDDD